MKKHIFILLLFASLFSSAQIVKNQEWEFSKKVTFDDSVRITTGATNGYVLTSDTRGIATWQASGSGVVQSATVTLDSADIVSLHTTPITIIPAQGSGTVIQLIAMTISMDYNSIPYATDVTLRLLNGVSVANQDGSCLSSASDYYANKNLQSNYSVSGGNTFENVAITMTTPTSNPTAGNSSLKITVLYTVITL